MDQYSIKITPVGWFTCDAGFYCPENGRFVKCPDFETIQELAEWVSENVEY